MCIRDSIKRISPEAAGNIAYDLQYYLDDFVETWNNDMIRRTGEDTGEVDVQWELLSKNDTGLPATYPKGKNTIVLDYHWPPHQDDEWVERVDELIDAPELSQLVKVIKHQWINDDYSGRDVVGATTYLSVPTIVWEALNVIQDENKNNNPIFFSCVSFL